MKKLFSLILFLLVTVMSSFAQDDKVGTFPMSYYGVVRDIYTARASGGGNMIYIQAYAKEKGTTAYLTMRPGPLCKHQSVDELVEIRDLYVKWKKEAMDENVSNLTLPFPISINYCGFLWKTEEELCFCRQYQFTPIFLVENGKCHSILKLSC